MNKLITNNCRQCKYLLIGCGDEDEPLIAVPGMLTSLGKFPQRNIHKMLKLI